MRLDQIFLEVKETLGNPSVTFLDFRPVTYRMCIINSHDVAEQISRPSKVFPWSTPKSPTLASLVNLTGAESLLNKNVGERRNPIDALSARLSPFWRGPGPTGLNC